MTALKAIWKNGQVVLEGHGDWPEGQKLVVHEETIPRIKFLTEAEQSDDPDEIQKWIDDLRSIPPLPEDPELDSENQAWDEKMRLFNIEAVRKQFEGETT